MSGFTAPSRNRVDEIRRHAIRLARSGGHASIQMIEAALSREGFRDADQALYDPSIRSLLQRLCATNAVAQTQG
jgi:hypothetical protein